MSYHLVRGISSPINPVPLNHALSDDPPILVGLLPDAPLDHLIPFPADFSAVFEGGGNIFDIIFHITGGNIFDSLIL